MLRSFGTQRIWWAFFKGEWSRESTFPQLGTKCTVGNLGLHLKGRFEGLCLCVINYWVTSGNAIEIFFHQRGRRPYSGQRPPNVLWHEVYFGKMRLKAADCQVHNKWFQGRSPFAMNVPLIHSCNQSSFIFSAFELQESRAAPAVKCATMRRPVRLQMQLCNLRACQPSVQVPIFFARAAIIPENDKKLEWHDPPRFGVSQCALPQNCPSATWLAPWPILPPPKTCDWAWGN